MEVSFEAWGEETVKLHETPPAPPWDLGMCEEVFSLTISACVVAVLVTEECHQHCLFWSRVKGRLKTWIHDPSFL